MINNELTVRAKATPPISKLLYMMKDTPSAVRRFSGPLLKVSFTALRNTARTPTVLSTKIIVSYLSQVQVYSPLIFRGE